MHRRGLSPDAADDLLQEFVASKILEKDLIAHARRDAGKFRTFMLTALDRFALNRLRDEHAKKRSPEHGRVVAMGEHVERLPSEEQPTEAFHAAWAHRVISEALGRMRVQCERSGRADLWAVFECRVVGPLLEGTEPVDYGELVRRFGFRSPSQASNVLIIINHIGAAIDSDLVSHFHQPRCQFFGKSFKTAIISRNTADSHNCYFHEFVTGLKVSVLVLPCLFINMLLNSVTMLLSIMQMVTK